MVGRLDDGELESSGVLEVQVELAVLGLVRRPGARSGVDLESVKTEGDDLDDRLVVELALSRELKFSPFRRERGQ